MFNPDQNRLAPTLAMIMAASLVGFITGYTVPLISLELAQQQIAPLYVGLLAALPPAGMMISSFLSPALCRRVEMGVLLSGSLILLALATIASCMTTDMTLLLLPRLLTGLASGVIIVLGESWITGGAAGSQRAAGDDRREPCHGCVHGVLLVLRSGGRRSPCTRVRRAALRRRRTRGAGGRARRSRPRRRPRHGDSRSVPTGPRPPGCR